MIINLLRDVRKMTCDGRMTPVHQVYDKRMTNVCHASGAKRNAKVNRVRTLTKLGFRGLAGALATTICGVAYAKSKAEACVTSTIKKKAKSFVRLDKSAFQNGFMHWERAKGGAFDIPITDIPKLLRQTMGAKK